MSMLAISIPVKTPLGEGTTVYVTDCGVHMNDMWCVCLDDGRILHFLSSDLTHVGNGSLGVVPPKHKFKLGDRVSAHGNVSGRIVKIYTESEAKDTGGKRYMVKWSHDPTGLSAGGWSAWYAEDELSAVQ